MKKCLTPECNNQVGYDQKEGVNHGARGLCKSCHGVACGLIRKKQTTWEELESIGLAESPAVEKAAFRAEFEKRKAAIIPSPIVYIPRELAEFALRWFNNYEAPLSEEAEEKVKKLRELVYGVAK